MIYQSYFSHDSHVSIICITWPSFLHHFSIHGPRWFCWRFCSPWGRPSSLYRPVGAPRDAAMGARGSLDGGGVVFGAPFNHLSSFIYVYAFVSMGLSILYVYANIYIYICVCVCTYVWYDMCNIWNHAGQADIRLNFWRTTFYFFFVKPCLAEEFLCLARSRQTTPNMFLNFERSTSKSCPMIITWDTDTAGNNQRSSEISLWTSSTAKRCSLYVHPDVISSVS